MFSEMKNRLTRTTYLIAGLIALITFLVYLPALQNDFVNFDDDEYVYENPSIQQINLSFLKWAFFQFHVANWHPLTWISHAIDYAVWGLNPFGHHLTNNFLHTANTFIIVLLLVRLLTIGTGREGMDVRAGLFSKKGMLVTAATAGMLFGIHPIHVESVVWISERKDVLCGLFFLLSILAYMSYVEAADSKKGIRLRILNPYYLAAFGCFLLALLSKPMAVTLPVILLLLDWYPLKRFNTLRSFKVIALEKIPFLLLSIGSSLVTIFAQHSSQAIASLDSSSFVARVFIAAKALSVYLIKMILPIHLAPLYPYPQSIRFFSLPFLLSAIFIVTLTLVCILAFRKRKLWMALWGYYVITLLPVSGLVQVGFQSMADRYTYLPSLGPFLAFGLIVTWLYQKIDHQGKKIMTMFVSVIAVFALVLLSHKTISQIGLWKDSLTLWNYEIEKEPEINPVAYYHRGIAYQDNKQFADAIPDYTRAIALKPDYYEAYNNRGTVYDELGQHEAAIKDYTRALALNPHFRIYCNRGVNYAILGLFGQAIEDFNRAIELQENYPEAYVNRGFVYLKMGNHTGAVSDFQKGCSLGNGNACAELQKLQSPVNTRKRL